MFKAMSFKTKLFWVLWLVGIVGVVLLLTLPLEIPAELSASVPLPAIKLLVLLQPTVLLTISVLIGLNLAPAVGLSAPMMEAIASGKPLLPAIKPQIVPGMVGGVSGGFALVLISWLWQSRLPAALLEAPATPPLIRFFYGGITEEILLRWGWMTLFLWGAWSLLQRRQSSPNHRSVAIAIVLSASIFGIGHLPLVVALNLALTTSLVLYIVIANSVFGLIAGYLYWKHGLEAAMIAHILCHVVMLTMAQVIA